MFRFSSDKLFVAHSVRSDRVRWHGSIALTFTSFPYFPKVNQVSTKSGMNTICRLNSLVIFPVKARNSFKVKYFGHLMRVLIRLPETKGMSKFTVPHFSREEGLIHLIVERM